MAHQGGGGVTNAGFQPAVVDVQHQQQQYSSQQHYGMQYRADLTAPPAAVMGGQDLPVTQQPTAGTAGAVPPGLSEGLGYLRHVDQLVVQQQVELLEMFSGFETANKYIVRNSLGQQVFYVVEDTGCCNRQCCGPARSFDIRVLDSQQREVLHLSRPLRCQCCCCFCCLQELEVTADGRLLGRVTQDWTLIKPQFSVRRPDGATVLSIRGPYCPCSCGSDVNFNVTSKDGEHQVGKITKQWTGWAQELFTDADVFGITFPMDLDVDVKATLLGALFLIDFMYFETKKNNN